MMKSVVSLLALLSSLSVYARGNGSDIQTIPLSTCLVAKPPTLLQADNGNTDYDRQEWDYHQNCYYKTSCLGGWISKRVSCDKGTFLDQSITYYYQERETDELVITTRGAPPVTRTITKLNKQSETYRQEGPDSAQGWTSYQAEIYANCQSRQNFAEEALQHFQDFYQNTIVPQLCQKK